MPDPRYLIIPSRVNGIVTVSNSPDRTSDLMKFYHDNSVIRHGADLNEIEIDYQSKITVGKFIDIEKPTYLDCLNDGNRKKFGDKYKPYGGADGHN